MQISIRSQKNLKNDGKKGTGCSNSRWESGTCWSDLEDNSDDEEIIESEDSVDGQSSPQRHDDASIVSIQTISADDEFTVSSGEKSDSEDSSEHDSDDLAARSSFTGKNDRM